MMDQDLPVWPDTQRRIDFFDKLHNLLGEYPELTNGMARYYARDGAAFSYLTPIGDEPAYDPASPVMVTGIVLCIAMTNTEGWEDMVVTEPFGQSMYLTHGMIGEALTITGREY